MEHLGALEDFGAGPAALEELDGELAQLQGLVLVFPQDCGEEVTDLVVHSLFGEK